jgi:hypothetical protein
MEEIYIYHLPFAALYIVMLCTCSLTLCGIKLGMSNFIHLLSAIMYTLSEFGGLLVFGHKGITFKHINHSILDGITATN